MQGEKERERESSDSTIVDSLLGGMSAGGREGRREGMLENYAFRPNKKNVPSSPILRNFKIRFTTVHRSSTRLTHRAIPRAIPTIVLHAIVYSRLIPSSIITFPHPLTIMTTIISCFPSSPFTTCAQQ